MTVQTARVGDIAQQLRGVSFSKGEAVSESRDGYIAVMTASNITEQGLKLDSSLYISTSKVRPHQLLRPNDLVITASSGSLSVVGRSALVRQTAEATFGAFCKVLRPNASVNPNYLGHFFRTPDYRARVSQLAAGANINNLRNEDLDNLEIPLPSLPEQRRIATILDQADELRAKRRSAIAFLDGLMDALFTSMFCDARARVASSWSVRLSDVARIKSGSTPDRKRPDYFGGGIPWVKTTEVHGDRILSTGESVSEAGQKSARLQLFPANSIVIAMYGQGKTRGQSAVLGIDATVNQACAVILPSEKFHVDFMAQQLRLSYERLRAKAQGGNQANLNLQLVGDLDVLVPPIAEQNLFAGNAKLLRELRNHNSLALSKLDELFASLQHRAFAGQL